MALLTQLNKERTIMKKTRNNLLTITAMSIPTLLFSAMLVAEEFTLKVVQPQHGSIKFSPAIPKDGRITKGEKITLTATADQGYQLDTLYQSMPGRWGKMYYESMSSTYTVIMDKDKTVSALFLPDTEFDGFSVKQNIVYAQPGVKPLKYDIYSPDGAKNLPIITIVHGGGWVSNTEDIMRGMARQIVKTGRYVVASVDYRWAGQADGDTSHNSMSDIISDVFGALAHIQEHASAYGGDPTRIAVTGDSAGGHLSATVASMPHMIGEGGFGITPGVFEFMPSYLPPNKKSSQVKASLTAAILVAAPSYGVFSDKKYGMAALQHFSQDPNANASWSKAIAPIYHIPSAAVREIPQYLIRGTTDPIIQKEMLVDYAKALTAKGQQVKHVEVEGANHAFFDWKPDKTTIDTYHKYGVPHVNDMLAFFDSVIYKSK